MKPEVEGIFSMVRLALTLFLLASVCLPYEILGQEKIPTNTWRTHFSYRNIIDVSISQNIAASTTSSLFILEENEIKTITKENGLSDIGISSLAYIGESLLIGYENGNLDVLSENQVSNYRFIIDSDIQESKRINTIIQYSTDAYVLTDFGVVVFNPEDGIVLDSYTNLSVDGDNLIIRDGAIKEDTLFLATPEGIIAGDLSGTVNLKDFRNWKRFGSSDGIGDGETNYVATRGGLVYTGIDSLSLYEYSGIWSPIVALQDSKYDYIGASNNVLYVITRDNIWKALNSEFEILNSELAMMPTKVVGDSESDFVCTNMNGLVEISNSGERAIFPSGPFTNDVFRIFTDEQDLIAVSGGFDENIEPFNRLSGFYQFTEGEWVNVNSVDPANSIAIPEFRDVTSYSRYNGSPIISSFGQGLLLLNDDGSSTIIDETTPGSELENPDNNGVKVSSTASVLEGIWILNYGAASPYKFLSNEGIWTSLTFQGITTQYPIDLAVAPNQDIWVILDPNRGGGVLVFNSDGSESRVLTTQPGQGNLPSNVVNSIRFDREGQAWVATDEGIVFFPFTNSVLTESEVDGVIPIFENRLLFRDEQVTAVEIDGGDRKWMSTRDALWLFDKTINTLIARFDSENSPLFDSPITSLRINGRTGELFIGADGGIVSYQTDASEGGATQQTQIKIFPNPIRLREFSGVVTVEGLVENAFVKITDVAGRLVWQDRANGGTFSWNLRDLNGDMPQSGIYLIFSSNSDGSETIIGKLALIN